MSSDNHDTITEKELSISDLFLNILNYKYISSICIIFPLILSLIYLFNRELSYTAEIEIFENKIVQSLNLTPSYQAPYMSYLEAFQNNEDGDDKIDTERLYNSFIGILRQMKQTEIDSLKFEEEFGEKMLAHNIYIEEDKRANKTVISFRFKSYEHIPKVVNKILSETNLLNKQFLKNDLEDKLYYIAILKDNAITRHNEQIELTKIRLRDKISYLQNIQNKKIDRVILNIKENLEIARSANIIEPFFPEKLNFSASNNNDLEEWTTTPLRSLELSSEEGIGDSKANKITIPSVNGQEYSNIINTGMPLFYYGVNVLEKELEMVVNRKNNELLTPGLDELATELNNIDTNKNDAYVIYLEYLNDLDKNITSKIKRLNSFIVNDTNIQTALYNIDKLKINQNSLNSYFVILIALILGFIVASILVTILRAIDNSKN